MKDLYELIRFDASYSYDPDGSILSYFWDFGDGTNATMCIILDHPFNENGEHLVTLTVTDNDGASSSTSMNIEVHSPSSWPLFLVAGIALGVTALTGTTVYAVLRRKRKPVRESMTQQRKPVVTLYLPRGFFAGHEELEM